MARASIVAGLLILLMLSGCAATNKTNSNTSQTKKDTVTAAPLSLFISQGAVEQYNFHGHSLQIAYPFASPQHILEITIDGNTRRITLSHDQRCVGGHCQYHQVIEGLESVIEPVTRTGDTWSTHTWDTDELYVEIDTPAPRT